jgi:hypothetical protein
LIPPILRLTLLLAGISLLCGCSNGLPSDLVGHLANRGIQVAPAKVHASSSSRTGNILVPYSTETATNIITTFKLQRIQPEDRQWSWAISRVGELSSVKKLWGLSGRPTQFKLGSGRQFESLRVLFPEACFDERKQLLT